MEKPETTAAELLNYGSPPPPRRADPRRMFLYLLPAAICIASAAGSLMIEVAFPNGDSRNFAGPGLFLIMAPLALAFGIMAIREALRAGGLRALLWGVAGMQSSRSVHVWRYGLSSGSVFSNTSNTFSIPYMGTWRN